MTVKPVYFGIALSLVLLGQTALGAGVDGLAPAPRRQRNLSNSLPVRGKEANAAMAAAVRRYLEEMKTASEGTLMWQDSQGFASQLVQEMMAGQSSTLDQLQADTGSVLARTRRVKPPPPCLQHHAASISLLIKTEEIFSRMARAASAKDMNALLSVTGEMAATDGDTKALKNLEAELKRRFGIEGD